MPQRKGPAKIIPFPVASSVTSVPPDPASPQAISRKPVEITRSVAQGCLPGVRRKLFLQWIGSSEQSLAIEYQMSRRAGVTTPVLMRMMRAEARAEHRELFFSRAKVAA